MNQKNPNFPEADYGPVGKSTKPEVRSPGFSVASHGKKKHQISLLSFLHLAKRNLTYPTYTPNSCDDKMKQHM